VLHLEQGTRVDSGDAEAFRKKDRRNSKMNKKGKIRGRRIN